MRGSISRARTWRSDADHLPDVNKGRHGNPHFWTDSSPELGSARI